MDVHALSKGIGLFNAALVTFRHVLDLMPDNAQKKEALAALEQAEREFKIAEATDASKLGYEICRNHFPPEIMLSSDRKNWECPVCHNKINKSKPFLHL